jgi:mono/diheme cytochrome c family protein
MPVATSAVSVWLRRVRNLVFVLLALVAVGAGALYAASDRKITRQYEVVVPDFAQPIPRDSVSLAEGERLAHTRGCTGCHARDLGGDTFFSEPWVATAIAPNLTQVAAQRTDAELELAIRHGLRPDGTPLFGMPSEMFRVLTDGDVARIIAYVRSVPLSPRDPGRSSFGPLGRIGLLRGDMQPARYYIENERIPAVPDSAELRTGHYVAWSSCTECHGGELKGDGMGSPALGPLARAYSAEEFSKFLQTGISRDGRELRLMTEMVTSRFRYLRADEVASLHGYLRTLE